MKSTLPTVGEMARRLNRPVHQIEYIIRARGIEPSGWAGNARVFSNEDVERIASELEALDVDRIDSEDGQ